MIQEIIELDHDIRIHYDWDFFSIKNKDEFENT